MNEDYKIVIDVIRLASEKDIKLGFGRLKLVFYIEAKIGDTETVKTVGETFYEAAKKMYKILDVIDK